MFAPKDRSHTQCSTRNEARSGWTSWISLRPFGRRVHQLVERRVTKRLTRRDRRGKRQSALTGLLNDSESPRRAYLYPTIVRVHGKALTHGPKDASGWPICESF